MKESGEVCNLRENKTSEKNNTEKTIQKNSWSRNINPIIKWKRKKWKIELCGVARAFVQISENGPQSKKFDHPCSRWNYN